MFKTIKIRTIEAGLVFRDGVFERLLGPGRHWLFDLLGKLKIERVALRAPWLVHEQLDVIAKSGVLEGRATVLDLKDHERALVWVDGRFSHVLGPGLFAYWTTPRKVEVELIDARSVRFTHKELPAIARQPLVDRLLDVQAVEAGHAGVLLIDGNFVETLPPGQYAFWKNVARVKLVPVDLRETMLDVGGQEIMTADKVTLRLTAVVTFRVSDPRLAVSVSEDVRTALYREVQLVLRAVVGTRELDALLTGKDAVAADLEQLVRRRATGLGLEILAVGIRDVMLPGEMKDLLNKVTEAKKAAEANLIARREETAAMRSQANTAKLLQDNPTLMRLRELEVVEKVAGQGKLNVVLGDKGLTERVVNVL